MYCQIGSVDAGTIVVVLLCHELKKASKLFNKRKMHFMIFGRSHFFFKTEIGGKECMALHISLQRINVEKADAAVYLFISFVSLSTDLSSFCLSHFVVNVPANFGRSAIEFTTWKIKEVSPQSDGIYLCLTKGPSVKRQICKGSTFDVDQTLLRTKAFQTAW